MSDYGFSSDEVEFDDEFDDMQPVARDTPCCTVSTNLSRWACVAGSHGARATGVVVTTDRVAWCVYRSCPPAPFEICD
jgi:hypothetical protein